VEFKSAASVMAVCEFCKTTLLKDAASVQNLGKMSAVLEDYSPLQIGSSGRFEQRSFSLIGRIQLQYSAGFWNEWYALFDDGGNGWLSDASGQFAFTFAAPAAGTGGALGALAAAGTFVAPGTAAAARTFSAAAAAGAPTLPLFEKLQPGRALTLNGQTYTTADVRTARCTAGQGELPFKVGQGWQARVADFRAEDRFLSLDYSDGDPARVYLGRAVELADLEPQLLREPDQIAAAAGRFRGKVSALACPSCGAPVNCVAGITVHIVCPSCHAEVDTSGAVATVLAAGAALERIQFTLALGAEAVISGIRYSILGAMRRAASDGGSAWSEYLLYAPGKDFIWLIETDEGWQKSRVLDRWPVWDGSGHATQDGLNFNRSSEYGARVTFAAGSFNWRVSVGDEVRVTEFANGVARLAAEASNEELTWSRSATLPLDQVRAWFGGRVHVELQPHPKYGETARRVLIAFLVINAIPLLFATDNSLPYALIGAAAIYLPAYFFDRLDAAGQ
jgi:hypothetical protein